MTVKLIWQRFKIYTLHMFFFLLAILYCLYFEMLFFNFRFTKILSNVWLNKHDNAYNKTRVLCSDNNGMVAL